MENKTSGGIGFTGMLTIVFIVLKLTGTIDWSWLWVLSPLWILSIIYLIVFIGIAIYYKCLNAKYKREYMKSKKRINNE